VKLEDELKEPTCRAARPKRRAARHGRSMEEEADILGDALKNSTIGMSRDDKAHRVGRCLGDASRPPIAGQHQSRHSISRLPMSLFVKPKNLI
jgi:plasmid stability protein